MKTRSALVVVLFGVSTLAAAQTTPRIVPYSGVAVDQQGRPRTGVLSVTFAVYEEQTGGVPLWVEVHTVEPGPRGEYSAVLGSLSPDGMPIDVFVSGAARWLGVQLPGESEQPRMKLVSVPYALKAADAETLGGVPASAFLRADRTFIGGGKPDEPAADRVRPPSADRDSGERIPAVSDPVTQDQVIPDDLIVQQSLCVGFDCINNENFGFTTIKLKENNLRITFEDTSVGAFPSNDWQITANDSAEGGTNKFSIEDVTGAKVPMTIVAGAPTDSLFVSSTGRVGFRTSTPVLDIQTTTTNTPGMRLEQTSGGGFTAQSWDVAGNEANFFVRDVTSGSRLPLRIRPGAPTSSLDIAASGNVGIGVGAPTAKLHVDGNVRVDGPVISSSSTAGDLDADFYNTSPTGYGALVRTAANDATRYSFEVRGNTSRPDLTVLSNGNVGVGTTNPTSKLHVMGNVTVDGTFGRVVSATATASDLGADFYNTSPTGYGTLVRTAANDAIRYSFEARGNSNRADLTILSNGNVGIGNAAPVHPLHMGSGAHVTIGGVWTNASSRALKDNIRDLGAADALNALKALKPVTFAYKASPQEQQVGFIAEDVPDLVATADRKGLAEMDIVAVLTKVVQQQQETITALSVRLAAVEKALRHRESR